MLNTTVCAPDLIFIASLKSYGVSIVSFWEKRSNVFVYTTNLLMRFLLGQSFT